MRTRNVGRIIILSAFVIMICLSKVIWFFVEPYADNTNYENRQLASLPAFTLNGYRTYSEDYTRYFNDNLQFRNNLISLNSCIDYYCFGTSSSDSVIVGKDNWLFYSRVDDGDPIGCYEGTNLYTKDELARIAENCIDQRNRLLSRGKEFVILIVPNKERVYYEYMPTQYGLPADNYGALQIYNYLKTNTDLRIVYPYDELMKAKNDIKDNIWYKTDTHWNFIGGYIGAAALMSELGIEMPELCSDAIIIKKTDGAAGDLADMLNLTRQLRHVDSEYSVEGYDLHERETIEWDFWGMARYHASNADPRSIYVIRDSMATHLAMYIGSQFTDSYLRHKESYSYGDLESCDADIVVYETSERHADSLAYFSVM